MSTEKKLRFLQWCTAAGIDKMTTGVGVELNSEELQMLNHYTTTRGVSESKAVSDLIRAGIEKVKVD